MVITVSVGSLVAKGTCHINFLADDYMKVVVMYMR